MRPFIKLLTSTFIFTVNILTFIVIGIPCYLFYALVLVVTAFLSAEQREKFDAGVREGMEKYERMIAKQSRKN